MQAVIAAIVPRQQGGQPVRSSFACPCLDTARQRGMRLPSTRAPPEKADGLVSSSKSLGRGALDQRLSREERQVVQTESSASAVLAWGVPALTRLLFLALPPCTNCQRGFHTFHRPKVEYLTSELTFESIDLYL